METVTISYLQAGLMLLALVTCMVCIWMVFFFGRKVQTSAYLRDSLVASAKAEEYRNILRELDDRRQAGPLDPENQPPRGFEETARYIWRPDYSFERYYMFGSPIQMAAPPPGGTYFEETAEQRAERHKREDEERKKEQEEEAKRREGFEKWIDEERKRYSEECKKAEAEALTRAEKKIPTSMDISLLGGGWSFLLEFSTVIVIIFVLLALGILGAITGKDLTTILASVAGYVLGKATASQPSTASVQTPRAPPLL